MKIFFSIYDVDRRYGGPEEGGWYYDALQHVKSFERDIPLMDITEWVADLRDHREECNPLGHTLKALHKLVDRVNVQDGRTRDLGSVLSNGKYTGMFEETPGENQTQTRPQYC